jgi:hypothetical protein
MADEIEILKPAGDSQRILSPPERKSRQPRQGWTETRVDETAQRSILSPEGSSGGDVNNFYDESINFQRFQRSPAYSEPNAVMSPSTPSGVLSPTTEFPYSKSFDSSSISSRTSKRTSVSAEMSSLIRQKVRQQARSLVDKKRGSVQLAKRLLRSQTLQSAEVPFSPDDYEATDRQLEGSLQVCT